MEVDVGKRRAKKRRQEADEERVSYARVLIRYLVERIASATMSPQDGNRIAQLSREDMVTAGGGS